jgi:hypothetical protein
MFDVKVVTRSLDSRESGRLRSVIAELWFSGCHGNNGDFGAVL